MEHDVVCRLRWHEEEGLACRMTRIKLELFSVYNYFVESITATEAEIGDSLSAFSLNLPVIIT